MSIKNRSIFAFNNFRGLDLENKPLKVKPFRASDGYNFIIDSETLKTRPAFKFKKEIPFAISEGEYLIDWHKYRGAIIYVTNKNIYIENFGYVVNNESSQLITSNDLNVEHEDYVELNFEGKKPIFQEEKDCLFIFGLGGIYVYSFHEQQQVLYELSRKNEVSDTYVKKDDLPSPYEPTLMIGDNKFEDVNLLSNVVKYQLFANKSKDNNGLITYRLPTHYDEKKHGILQPENYKVDFYKGRYDDFRSFPIFLGKLGENFHGNMEEEEYGAIRDEFEIEETFYPTSGEFVYYGEKDEDGNITITSTIIETLNLDRDTFFAFHEKESNKNVFEYIMNYIKLNNDDITENKVLKFKLDVEYMATVKNDSQIVIGVKKIKKKFDIYVFLMVTEVAYFSVVLKNLYSTERADYSDGHPDYPNQPDFPDTPEGVTLITDPLTYKDDEGNIIGDDEGNAVPVVLPVSEENSQKDFTSSAEAYIYSKKDSFFEDNDTTKSGKFAIRGEFKGPERDSPWYNTAYSIDFVYKDNDYHKALIGEYPDYTPEEGRIYLGEFVDEWSFPNGINPYEIEKYAMPFIQTLVEERDFEGFGYIKFICWGEKYPGYPEYAKVYYGMIEFRSIKHQAKVAKAQRFLAIYEIEKGKVDREKTPYEIGLSKDGAFFELKVKDYFYDFNNEPTIDVKITFPKNPDYELISKCTFGTTFGSENRLFLAGHPDYPNIDHYNVSNDLLGENIKSQSYELSYFPSKNRRVVGGKGAINGYVVSTDNQLYITKEDYKNDSKLFIRTRTMDDNGIVGYNEHKTSVTKTPLNERCIVRFNNDILMLTKDGLYAIELTSNVLTDERLVKLRSSFINKDLVNKIKSYSGDIYMLENNEYLYIFIGKTVYVCDSRYLSKNDYGEIDNFSYEIVKWITNNEYQIGKFEDGLVLYDRVSNMFYELRDDDKDDCVTRHDSSIKCHTLDESYNVFQINGGLNYIFDEPEKYVFRLYRGYKLIAKKGVDFSVGEEKSTITNPAAFRFLSDGDQLYYHSNEGFFKPFVMSGLKESDRESFNNTQEEGDIYLKIDNMPLYITHIFKIGENIFFRLSIFKPPQVFTHNLTENAEMAPYLLDNNDFDIGDEDNMKDVLINKTQDVEFRWVSLITDFGNNIMEKTSFKAFVYATAIKKSAKINFGYKTMSRTKEGAAHATLPNAYNLDEFNFNSFTLSSFNEFGMSLPLKENNFLYIQFIITVTGQVELNGFEILYKNNRMLKTIG